MQEQATSSLPSSSERSSSSALQMEVKEVDLWSCAKCGTLYQAATVSTSLSCAYLCSIESDDEIRRVPEIGSEAAGPSTSCREASSVAGADRVQASSEVVQRKRGRSPADKENKRLKRLLRNRVSAQQARERKKAYLNELEVRVKDLETKNSELDERLSTLQNENQMLRLILKNTTASRRGGSSSANEGSV